MIMAMVILCLIKLTLLIVLWKTVRVFDGLPDGFVYQVLGDHAKQDGIYVSYDSSNMNTVAGSLALAEYGHAKDNPDLPLVNLSIGYNQTDEVPMFYEIYPGKHHRQYRMSKNGGKSEILWMQGCRIYIG